MNLSVIISISDSLTNRNIGTARTGLVGRTNRIISPVLANRQISNPTSRIIHVAAKQHQPAVNTLVGAHVLRESLAQRQSQLASNRRLEQVAVSVQRRPQIANKQLRSGANQRRARLSTVGISQKQKQLLSNRVTNRQILRNKQLKAAGKTRGQNKRLANDRLSVSSRTQNQRKPQLAVVATAQNQNLIVTKQLQNQQRARQSVAATVQKQNQRTIKQQQDEQRRVQLAAATAQRQKQRLTEQLQTEQRARLSATIAVQNRNQRLNSRLRTPVREALGLRARQLAHAQRRRPATPGSNGRTLAERTASLDARIRQMNRRGLLLERRRLENQKSRITAIENAATQQLLANTGGLQQQATLIDNTLSTVPSRNIIISATQDRRINPLTGSRITESTLPKGILIATGIVPVMPRIIAHLKVTPEAPVASAAAAKSSRLSHQAKPTKTSLASRNARLTLQSARHRRLRERLHKSRGKSSLCIL